MSQLVWMCVCFCARVSFLAVHGSLGSVELLVNLMSKLFSSIISGIGRLTQTKTLCNAFFHCFTFYHCSAERINVEIMYHWILCRLSVTVLVSRAVCCLLIHSKILIFQHKLRNEFIKKNTLFLENVQPKPVFCDYIFLGLITLMQEFYLNCNDSYPFCCVIIRCNLLN